MKKFMDVYTKITDKICYYVNFFSMATVIIMMILICIDVVMGNILRRPIAGMYEICQVILTMLVFTSWAYTQTQHGHIHVVMFVSKMPQKLRFVLFSLTALLSTVVMAYASSAVYQAMLSKKASRECTGTLLIPYWPFYAFEALSFALMTIILLRDSIKSIIAIWNKEFAEEVQASWV